MSGCPIVLYILPRQTWPVGSRYSLLGNSCLPQSTCIHTQLPPGHTPFNWIQQGIPWLPSQWIRCTQCSPLPSYLRPALEQDVVKHVIEFQIYIAQSRQPGSQGCVIFKTSSGVNWSRHSLLSSPVTAIPLCCHFLYCARWVPWGHCEFSSCLASGKSIWLCISQGLTSSFTVAWACNLSPKSFSSYLGLNCTAPHKQPS